MAYVLSEQAENDLTQIYEYSYFNFGIAQARKYTSQIRSILDEIAYSPRIARIRGEVGDDIRVHPYASHIIIYRIMENDEILIIRIRHAHEDWIHEYADDEIQGD